MRSASAIIARLDSATEPSIWISMRVAGLRVSMA